jgi:transcriptional regulator with XRE-family HTH domain
MKAAFVPRRRTYNAPVNEDLIGDRLRELRKKRGLTQTEIAERLGINQTLVSQYERGKLRLHGALIAALARALRVSSDEILGLRNLSENGQLKDRRLLRRLERIEKLPKRKKQALLTTIDAYLVGD